MAGGMASLGRSLMWGAIAFGVVLAVVIGVRLEQAALAAVVGVACGVAASIPTSLLIVAIWRWRSEKHQEGNRQPMAQPPPMVLLTPQTALRAPQPGAWPEEYGIPVAPQRQFSVIGEEETADL